jgi:hypothetical protein
MIPSGRLGMATIDRIDCIEAGNALVFITTVFKNEIPRSLSYKIHHRVWR